MSTTRDYSEIISNLRGVRPATRGASGTAGGRWQDPTPILPPRRGQNPFSGGRSGSNDAADSSQRAQKRQKLEHDALAKYFPKPLSEPRTRSQRAQVVLSSSPLRSRTADPVVINKGDTSGVDDSSSKPATLKASSPDPMDMIDYPPAYSFDTSKPLSMQQFSSSLEEMRRSPTDSESTVRLRNMKQTESQHSPSRPYGDIQSAATPRVAPSGQADGSPRKNRATELRSLLEYLRAPTQQHRENAVKPKQRQLQGPQLPMKLRDPHAPRPSGSVGGSGPSKGKATRRDIVCQLPLEEWSIGVDIPPHKVTVEPRAYLIWDRGLLKVQHVDSSILFELHFEIGSLGLIQFVDAKKSSSVKPLIQILPLETAAIQSSTTKGFKLGSQQDDGLLTFKFDSDATDWNADLYSELVQVLSGALVSRSEKFILDRSGALAVWTAVIRAHEKSVTT